MRAAGVAESVVQSRSHRRVRFSRGEGEGHSETGHGDAVVGEIVIGETVVLYCLIRLSSHDQIVHTKPSTRRTSPAHAMYSSRQYEARERLKAHHFSTAVAETKSKRYTSIS